ncbi:uncharacterized protein [Gossypium hirsutum]|uniref:Retrotransposon gag domain-containing protein n=1 Tax=Gossypium hirsutum TaxID=3635 RepID=A0ABM3BLJ9_GOSHI|nr:uncharacterized protein LOC121228934 [Gossypium hirsutum]
MVRSREESLEQKDQMAKMMEMMSALVEGKGPMNPDIVEPQSRVNLDQDPPYPPGFTPPHAHATQRGPADPLFPDLDDPAEIARLKLDDHDAKEKYRSLEERLKAIEGTEVFSVLNAKELSLVPDLVLPPKFKVPDSEKYDGTRCPKAHLIMFCQKMTGYVNEDKLIIHCFQDSLVGSALRWYNQLNRERIRSWKDLASTFCEQYKHVSDMVHDRMTLQMMKKKLTETFKQYAQRWRDISAQVEPSLTKTEITVLFINTLKAPFYNKLVGSATKDFVNIVISGELIENAIKSGRMKGSDSSRRAALIKKRKPETHMVGAGSRYTPNPYSNQPRPRYHLSPNIYFPLQNSYYQAPPPSYPVYATNNHRPIATFPQNTGHSTENCLAFKKRVQGLIDAGILRFDSASNATGNPIPDHAEGNVNVVTEEGKWQTRSCVFEIRTPLQKIWEVLVEKGLLCHTDKMLGERGQVFCNFHGLEGHNIQSYEEFRKLLQDMMDNKEIRIFNKREKADEGEVCTSDNQSLGLLYSANRPFVIYYDARKESVKPKIIIEVPSPLPYKDDKAVPRKYDINIVTPEGEKSEATIGDIGEVGHFTHSGRCYSKEIEPIKKNSDWKQKGKAVIINVIDKGNDAIKDVSMIRPCPPRFVLKNWTAVDLLVVFKSSPE